MRVLLEDVRYALRALLKRPLYACVTVLVLAIAIGANATVFSVFNGFFLRPLPYPDGDRLVMVYDSYPKVGLDNAGTAIPDYIERREQAPSLEDLAIVTVASRTLGGDVAPERVAIALASPSLFNVLGTQPLFGRIFTNDEATQGNERVAVLSHRLWSTRYGARPDVVGKDIRLDGESVRVIGVMPEGFGFPSRAVDAWLPFIFEPQQLNDAARGNQSAISVGRLRSGATVESLNSELAAIVRRNLEDGRIPADAVEIAGFTGRAQALRELSVSNLEQVLLVLQGIVVAVLLIACANVANFQLTRVAGRRKELAVRAALGAAPGRIVRLVLVESLMIAVVGAGAGLILALGGLELVRALGLDRASEGFEFVLDGTVLAFTLGATLAAALFSGLPPVLALLREDLTRAVREAGRQSGGGRSAQTLRSVMVVVQIAVSVALLVGAGLLTKSFYGLQSAGPGFNAGSIWTARLTLPVPRYPQQSWAQFQQQALAELRALPGVAEAGLTTVLPFSGTNNQGSAIIDGYVMPPGAAPPHTQYRSIDEGYFTTLGIPLIAGRNFNAAESDLVAIVDQNMAEKYWPAGAALGQRLRLFLDPEDRWYTIVGVVPAVKETSLADSAVKDTIYWHYRQRPARTGMFALRTTLPPGQLTRAANAAIAALDPDLALYDAVPMSVRVARSLGSQRTPMVLTLVFASVAFTLAVIGIYGVLAWGVTQRTGEIGVRLALGAKGADIVRMMLKQGGQLIALGLALGIVGALALGRVLASQLRDVSSVDPSVFAVAVVGLTAAALFASWLPARRAARIDPMRALREE